MFDKVGGGEGCERRMRRVLTQSFLMWREGKEEEKEGEGEK